MTEHGGAVLRLAYAFLLDRGRAEDVFQEVFVKAHQRAHRLHDPTVRAWLLKTTANQCRDLRRSWWWRLLARGVRSGGAGAEEEFAMLPDPSPPGAPVEAKDIRGAGASR